MTILPLHASAPASTMLGASRPNPSGLAAGSHRALKLGSSSGRPLLSCPSSRMPRVFCRTGIAAEPTVVVETPTVEVQLSRSEFPDKFMFGVATSAFQVEGGPGVGGRGYSIWDNFVHLPERIYNNYLHYPGPNFYEHYAEDIKMAADLGFTAFRLSIAWTRIYPIPNTPEFAEGIDFYNRVINCIVRNGLQPVVTLFHWDTPQYLESDPHVLGWRTKNILPLFVKYADTCYKHFGDRVKYWITINELWSYAILGHGYGRFAPGRCSPELVYNFNCDGGDSRTEPYLVGHHLLLAHAKAYRHYETYYKSHQAGTVGFAPAHLGGEPFSSAKEDVEATERFMQFHAGWQLDPLVFGDYPSEMKKFLKDSLPSFTKEESEEIKQSFDYIGHNYYTANYIKHQDVPSDQNTISIYNDGGFQTLPQNANGDYIGDLMGPEGSWLYKSPDNLLTLLKWITNRYGNLPCMITENGVMDKYPYDVEKSLSDTERTAYIQDHLTIVAKAIKELDLNIWGYLCWSLMDNFEWRDGFLYRFGIVHVNFEPDQEPIRTPKHSAKWFQEFLQKTT